MFALTCLQSLVASFAVSSRFTHSSLFPSGGAWLLYTKHAGSKMWLMGSDLNRATDW